MMHRVYSHCNEQHENQMHCAPYIGLQVMYSRAYSKRNWARSIIEKLLSKVKQYIGFYRSKTPVNIIKLFTAHRQYMSHNVRFMSGVRTEVNLHDSLSRQLKLSMYTRHWKHQQFPAWAPRDNQIYAIITAYNRIDKHRTNKKTVHNKLDTDQTRICSIGR